MIQLLVKDLRIQKLFIGGGFIFVGIFFFLLGAFEGLPLAVPAVLYSHFLIVVASKMDEKNKNGRMLASFPLRRRDIVTSKYAGIAMFALIAFALTFAWKWLASLMIPVEELPWFSLTSTLIAAMVLLLFYSLYFPMYFAFGSRIVQILDLIVIFAVGGAGVITLRILEWSNVNVMDSLRSLLSGGNLDAFARMGIVGCLALLLVSWRLSVFLYDRKAI